MIVSAVRRLMEGGPVGAAGGCVLVATLMVQELRPGLDHVTTPILHVGENLVQGVLQVLGLVMINVAKRCMEV